MSDIQNFHATTVDIEGRGVLIWGPSGSGKSTLALALIGLGAQLVADDQTFLRRSDDHLIATCAPHLKGVIEARGVGLVRVPHVESTQICLLVDMNQTEDKRLPEHLTHDLLGISIDKIKSSRGIGFAPALYYLVKNGKADL